MNWIPPPEGCIKINVNISKRYTTESTTIGFVREDMHGAIVMQEGTQFRDCSIIVAECLAIQEALTAAIKKTY